MNRTVETGANHLLSFYNMFEKGDLVCAAVSGGADSVALLHFLHSHSEQLGISLVACHVNHNLRGKESDGDEQFTKDFCRRLGVKLYVKSVDVNTHAATHKQTTEEAARNLRYMFFDELTQKLGCKIATAHTLTDKTETLLLNITRGTGIRGIASIPAVRGSIYRPLLSCTRVQIEDYCERHSLNFVTDSTNFEEQYSRNKIRLAVLPKLWEVNPEFEQAVQRLTAQAEQLNSYLDTVAKNIIASMAKGENTYDKRLYFSQDDALRPRIVELILKKHNTNLNSRLFEQMEREMCKPHAKLQIGEGLFLTVEKESFSLNAPAKQFEYKNELYTLDLKEQKGVLSAKSGQNIYFEQLCCEQIINFEKLQKNDLKMLLDYDKINGIAAFRHRREGDKIELWGRGVTKTLKKLLSEQKLPAYQRDKLFVLEDLQGIVWLEGFGCAERACVDKNTKKVLKISVK